MYECEPLLTTVHFQVNCRETGTSSLFQHVSNQNEDAFSQNLSTITLSLLKTLGLISWIYFNYRSSYYFIIVKKITLIILMLQRGECILLNVSIRTREINNTKAGRPSGVSSSITGKTGKLKTARNDLTLKHQAGCSHDTPPGILPKQKQDTKVMRLCTIFHLFWHSLVTRVTQSIFPMLEK